MLGDLLAHAEGAAAALPSALAHEIEAAGSQPEAFARLAVSRFERHASPEDWVNLMSRVSGAADPAQACLEFMVRWSLRATAPASLQEETHEQHHPHR
ncbi:hypothetical protein PE066_02920 [Ramlibacter tataouinensis]|uniref:hypothetical protein n=1 Tax=Ramlibacter tataouinensis TaxID=94132 RepID=UPI0022F3C091|nr:hypothetical protein [Ramlibacter tataouinensis]WBY02503.1 hypothetical protein PE066_02920 [Ramlibacter tataouinensis]